MSDLVEYFVRHYTLVLDNEQGSYSAVRATVRDAVREVAPDMSAREYAAMSLPEREATFGYNVGCNVLAFVEETLDESINTDDGLAGVLVREVMITDGYDMADALGRYYLPEVGEAEEFFDGDDDDDA